MECTLTRLEDHRAKPNDELVVSITNLMAEIRDEGTLGILTTTLSVLNACFRGVPDTHQNMVLRACTLL